MVNGLLDGCCSACFSFSELVGGVIRFGFGLALFGIVFGFVDGVSFCLMACLTSRWNTESNGESCAIVTVRGGLFSVEVVGVSSDASSCSIRSSAEISLDISSVVGSGCAWSTTSCGDGDWSISSVSSVEVLGQSEPEAFPLEFPLSILGLA